MGDKGCGMRDAGYGIRDLGYGIRDVGYGITERKIVNVTNNPLLLCLRRCKQAEINAKRQTLFLHTHIPMPIIIHRAAG